MASRAASRFGSHLKELRVHLCQKSPESQGVRDFVNKHYSDIKSANPDLPILIRECGGISPRVWARFEFGKESSADVSSLNSDDVLKAVQRLASAN